MSRTNSEERQLLCQKSMSLLYISSLKTYIHSAMPADNAIAPKRKLKPARKQVASDEVDKSQGYQAGREYSGVTLRLSGTFLLTFYPDIWYNKWAGGDREDALARCV